MTGEGGGQALLEVEDVELRHGEIAAVKGVDLVVNSGEIVGVLGANGAGKSTLVHGILGGIGLTHGSIRVGGLPIDAMSSFRRARLGMAGVPEGRLVFGRMTVSENLLMGLVPVERRLKRSKTFIRSQLDACYALFPVLHDRQEQRAGSLSGGEQQMLVIGRALMSNPRILILDEPSAGLAPLVMRDLFERIGSLRGDDRAVLLVEQNAVRTLGVADRVYVMELGKMSEEGTAQELLKNDRLVERYLGFDKTNDSLH